MSLSPIRWIRRAARSAGFERPLRAVYAALGFDRRNREKQQASEAEFQARYGNRLTHEVEFLGHKLVFTTEDTYSKHFFFPKFEGKIFEERVTRLLLEALVGKKCFVDVGSNLGWFTCFGAMTIPNGEVHAFELDDQNVMIARKNVALNGISNATVHHIALSSETGTVRYLRKPTLSSDANRIATNVDLRSGGTLIEVPSMKMDDFFASRSVPPDLIKIDVQGAELQVLQGMRSIIANHKPLLFLELHPTELPGFQATAGDVTQMLFDCGYEIEELPEMRGSGSSKDVRAINRNTTFRETTMLIAR